mmetsp:Transcript_12479/g.31511  ORF Transcript_12479/g.31511 Transcript_12479/m.31511 type:complete len:216 (+) Transcript_12479:726-1373(+)
MVACAEGLLAGQPPRTGETQESSSLGRCRSGDLASGLKYVDMSAASSGRPAEASRERLRRPLLPLAPPRENGEVSKMLPPAPGVDSAAGSSPSSAASTRRSCGRSPGSAPVPLSLAGTDGASSPASPSPANALASLPRSMWARYAAVLAMSAWCVSRELQMTVWRTGSLMPSPALTPIILGRSLEAKCSARRSGWTLRRLAALTSQTALGLARLM